MKKDINIKEYLQKLSSLLKLLQRYKRIVFILVVFAVFSFLILQIKSFSLAEPTDDAVTEKLLTVKRPKIDQSAIDKIQELVDQNVQVQALFNEARDNPFTD